MEEAKRDVNKSKRIKIDVKSIVKNYLQRRNYSTVQFLFNVSPEQHIKNILVETSVSCPNSILYSCCNCDPAVFEKNFGKVLTWVRDLTKNHNDYYDLEYVIAPLFCYLYLEILKGGNPDPANAFFKLHSPAIDKTKCDDVVNEFINGLAENNDVTHLINTFRRNRYHIDLTSNSMHVFRRFIAKNCHVVILHVVQTYFDINEIIQNGNAEEEGEEKEIQDEKVDEHLPQSTPEDPHLQELRNAIKAIESDPPEIFSVFISNSKENISCGILKRCYGILAYNTHNILHVRAIHPLDPIVTFHDCKEIELISHSDEIYDIAIGNRNILTVSADKTVSIYDIMDMTLIKNCQGHLGPVYCVEISSNDCYFATGSQDNTARLWDITNGVTLRVFAGHTSAVTCIDFHPNCLYVATGSADKTVRMWSIDNGNTLRLFCGSKGVIYSVKFSPTGDTLASAGDEKRIKLWDIIASKTCQEIKQKSETVTKIMWSRDGKQLCVSTVDGYIKLWANPVGNPELVHSTNTLKRTLCLEYCSGTFACINTIQ